MGKGKWGKGQGCHHIPTLLPPSRSGVPRAVTPKMPCDSSSSSPALGWGSSHRQCHLSQGDIIPPDAGRTSLTEEVRVALCVGCKQAQGSSCTSRVCTLLLPKGGGRKEKGKIKGLSVLWEHPKFLLLPRLPQCPFLWQGGTQHDLSGSLLPPHPSPCPSLTRWVFFLLQNSK